MSVTCRTPDALILAAFPDRERQLEATKTLLRAALLLLTQLDEPLAETRVRDALRDVEDRNPPANNH